MDILDRIAAYDCSDGGHCDAAQGSAYDLLNDAHDEITRLRALGGIPPWTKERIEALTVYEVVALMQSQDAINKARQKMYHGVARIEQAAAQRHPLSPVEARRREFLVVLEIAAALKGE